MTQQSSGISSPHAAPRRIGVQPVIDPDSGPVAFRVPRGSETRWTPEPARIQAALRRAVRPAQWDPAAESLTIIVAEQGDRRVREVCFDFAPAVPEFGAWI